MHISVSCPYCGEECSIVVDERGGRKQSYVEDCEVCCQPWQVTATVDSDGEVSVELRMLNE